MERFAALVAGRAGVPEGFDENGASISDIADHFGVTLRALRFYEQSGLIRPRRMGTQRLYSRDDFHRIRLVVALRGFEASIPAIRAVLELVDGRSDDATVKARIEDLLTALVRDVRERISHLDRLGGDLDEAMARLDGAD